MWWCDIHKQNLTEMYITTECVVLEEVPLSLLAKLIFIKNKVYRFVDYVSWETMIKFGTKHRFTDSYLNQFY